MTAVAEDLGSTEQVNSRNIRGDEMAKAKAGELNAELLTNEDSFLSRHIGPSAAAADEMLKLLGESTLEGFISKVVPERIRTRVALNLDSFPVALSEREAIERLRQLASKNVKTRSWIGLGYYNSITPPVIQRNILENPSWYTHYTPYQPEISQGRLEALLNFQTMICDLTGMEVANASLLDEGTAAAEAVGLALSQFRSEGREGTPRVIISSRCHPQTLAVVKVRAEALGITFEAAELGSKKFGSDVCAVIEQYPDTVGEIRDLRSLAENVHAAKAIFIVATDLLALTLLTPPGEFGADVAVGSSQRFGVPLGFGGPHAAFFATKDQFKRIMPGRLIGVSKDTSGNRALRLALQTREQHIRREKATSNICTAQVLLSVIASMYAVYHGPAGLKRIATAVRGKAEALCQMLRTAQVKIVSTTYFDTLFVDVEDSQQVRARAGKANINLRYLNSKQITVSVDETTTEEDLIDIVHAVSGKKITPVSKAVKPSEYSAAVARTSSYLTHPVFNSYHCETDFLRYVKLLESRDLSLGTAMIPLGSCTMKLNATSEMLPITWSEFGALHPFVPREQAAGYSELFADLESSLQKITGFAAVSLQPNAGSQGEYAGLLVIREYLKKYGKGESDRNVCLIPKSAHGTNPASAAMAGFEIKVVDCDTAGNVDIEDAKRKIAEVGSKLGVLMITYPSTHGVFEERVVELCKLVHEAGGQVYMDGANLNAQVGLCKPGQIGADVCHINLHKTFCIPHGGGGPGMGPIAVAAHLAEFLPNHPLADLGHASGIGPVSAAPWGSASILPIPWMYMAMMGGEGLTIASAMAILNSNYVARRLEPYYPVLYKGDNGYVAHECIIDLRPLKKTSGVEAEDIAKRLMDYGFHAPTVSFPVVGTLMIEPTESESKSELDRFCDAMIMIRSEIRAVEEGNIDSKNNPLKNAPHTAEVVCADKWDRPYSREVAAYPAPWSRTRKFWPFVGRIDGVYGDRNLVCSCPPVESYS